FFFFFSSRRRHTRSKRDWSSDVCSSDLSVSAYGMSETILGGNAAIPLSTVAPLKLSLLLEANGRLFDIRGATADDVPSIKTRFKIGRASCRERVEIWEGGGGIKQKSRKG